MYFKELLKSEVLWYQSPEGEPLAVAPNQELLVYKFKREHELYDREDCISEHDPILALKIDLFGPIEHKHDHQRDHQGIHGLQQKALLDEGHNLISPGPVPFEGRKELENEHWNEHIDDVDHQAREVVEHLGVVPEF